MARFSAAGSSPRPSARASRSTRRPSATASYARVKDNLRRWHKAWHGWHGAKQERIGGQPCNCHIHSALLQPALEAEEAIWLAAGAAAAEPQEAHADQWAAAAAASA